MQPDIPIGTFLVSEKSIGFDGVLAFYAGRDNVSELEFEEALVKHLSILICGLTFVLWSTQFSKSKCVDYRKHSNSINFKYVN